MLLAKLVQARRERGKRPGLMRIGRFDANGSIVVGERGSGERE